MNNPNGDTLPPKDENQKPAGSDGNTPPNNGSSPDPIEELKNQVEREKARAATAQQTAETAEKRARDERILRINAEKKLKALSGAGDGGNGAPAGDGQVNANDSEAEVERLNAEKGIANLIMMTPEYQALLQKDVTLKEVLLSNPLSLITEYIDAEDAVDQIKKKLDKRLAPADGGNTPPAGGDGKPAPKAGDVPPPSSDSVEMKGSVSPDAAVKMSAAEWDKIPKEQRRKMLLGEF